MSRTRRARILAIGAAAGALLGASTTVASAKPHETGILYVGSSVGTNKSCTSPGYTSVQSAVDASVNGATVYLCGATPYAESVLIENKSISLRGDPGATIEAPSNAHVPSTFFSSQNLQDPNSVVTLIGDENVQISGLTIQGPFIETNGCADGEFGVLVIGGATVQLDSDQVLNVAPSDSSLEGCQFGVAVQVGREYWPNTAGGYNAVNFVGQAKIQRTSVSGYAKNGITIDGPGSQANIDSSTVTGIGQTTAVAQNGIQISRGATGEVHDTSVSNNEYTGSGPNAAATGMLVYGGCGDPLVTDVHIHDNTFTNDDAAIDIGNFDSTCLAAPATSTGNQIDSNEIVKNDGITDHSPFQDESGNSYTGYQVGVADTGNGDHIHNNEISSTDGAYGPLVAPGGEFLAPVDVQTYPPIETHVHNNRYNGSPTNPPYSV